MVVTDEILAAYVDGTLSNLQKEEVRAYLAAHPTELEQIIKLMDTFPYDVDEDSSDKCNSILCDLKKHSIASSGSAFVVKPLHKPESIKVQSVNIHANITNLLNEIL